MRAVVLSLGETSSCERWASARAHVENLAIPGQCVPRSRPYSQLITLYSQLSDAVRICHETGVDPVRFDDRVKP